MTVSLCEDSEFCWWVSYSVGADNQPEELVLGWLSEWTQLEGTLRSTRSRGSSDIFKLKLKGTAEDAVTRTPLLQLLVVVLRTNKNKHVSVTF